MYMYISGQVSLFWETHTKLSLSDQERVLILESMRQLSLVNDEIVGMALGGAAGVPLWEVIGYHITYLF